MGYNEHTADIVELKSEHNTSGGLLMEYIGVFLGGLVAGAVFVLIINRFLKKDTATTFSALSFEALSKNSEEFLKLANEALSKQTATGAGELESKKKLIDQTLEGIRGNLQKVETLVTDFSKDREKKYGELSTQLKATAEQTGKLQDTTNQLHTALASTRIRGQWGERMAEDVLRLAGFIENINYRKQKVLESTTSRPDFTFMLPQDLIINMDVKFPLDNYMKFMNEESDLQKQAYKEQFLRDVRQRIKEVTTRDYINPEENTVDYVLVFIPNEQVYRFINENDREFIDEALKNKVVVCSPLSLYAILAVIRQAVDNFNMEKTASEMMALFRSFNKQWDAFKSSMSKMGKKLDDAKEEYNRLLSTRTNQLERPLRKINDLRQQKGISELSPAEEEQLLNGANENNLLLTANQDEPEE
ncbi:MAG TPA: DNA recombination protein RmuC [Dehalococcoidia bacterium]|nr:DNA recombination protein RmuC [Dehalococcoidia bacterium]